MLSVIKIAFPNIIINNNQHRHTVLLIRRMMDNLQPIIEDLRNLCSSKDTLEILRWELEIKQKLFNYSKFYSESKLFEKAHIDLDSEQHYSSGNPPLSQEELHKSHDEISKLTTKLNLKFEYNTSKIDFINYIETIIENEYNLIKALIYILKKQDVDVSELISKSKQNNCADIIKEVDKLQEIVDIEPLYTEVDEFDLPISCCNVEATRTLIALNDSDTIHEQDEIARMPESSREEFYKKKTIQKIKNLIGLDDITIDNFAKDFEFKELTTIYIHLKNPWRIHEPRTKEARLDYYRDNIQNIPARDMFSNEFYYKKKVLNSLIFLEPDILISRDFKYFAMYIVGLRELLTYFDPSKADFMTQSYTDRLVDNLKLVMYPLALRVYNFGWIAKQIVDIINNIMGFKYIIFDCKGALDSYTCGRAIWPFGFNYDKNSEEFRDFRIIVFNTVSDFDDGIDFDYLSDIQTQIEQGTYVSKDYN
jgi:hypothetical protein